MESVEKVWGEFGESDGAVAGAAAVLSTCYVLMTKTVKTHFLAKSPMISFFFSFLFLYNSNFCSAIHLWLCSVSLPQQRMFQHVWQTLRARLT